MPTMDLDASVLALCRRDPRFRPEAYHFLLESLDHTLKGRGPAAASAAPSTPASPSTSRVGAAGAAPWNVTGKDLLAGFRDLALERFGSLAREVLRFWGITRTEDVGAVVFNMVEAGLLQKTATDTPADYHAVFDFEGAFDGAFADLLKREEVRLSPKPAG